MVRGGLIALQHDSPFYRTRTDKERERDKGQTLGVWFNTEEINDLNEWAEFFQQEKPSTLIKTLMYIGIANLKGDKKIREIRDTLFKNVKNNTRLGITQIELKTNKS